MKFLNFNSDKLYTFNITKGLSIISLSISSHCGLVLLSARNCCRSGFKLNTIFSNSISSKSDLRHAGRGLHVIMGRSILVLNLLGPARSHTVHADGLEIKSCEVSFILFFTKIMRGLMTEHRIKKEFLPPLSCKNNFSLFYL